MAKLAATYWLKYVMTLYHKRVGLHRSKMASADWMCNGHEATSPTTSVLGLGRSMQKQW